MRKKVEIITCDLCGKETKCADLRVNTGESESDGVESKPVYATGDVCLDCLEKRLKYYFGPPRGLFASDMINLFHLKR